MSPVLENNRPNLILVDFKRIEFYREEAVGDDLSELQSDAVPEEVRKWLASTFAKQETVTRRRGPDERPSFRSVANAIRTGIFIERIYRRMSSSQLMVIPPEVQHALKVIFSPIMHSGVFLGFLFRVENMWRQNCHR